VPDRGKPISQEVLEEAGDTDVMTDGRDRL